MSQDPSTVIVVDRDSSVEVSQDTSGRRTERRGRSQRLSWVPSWGLVATKNLELRRRRGLMLVVILLTVGFPVLVLGLRLLFHAVDPRSYGPAGSPSVFSGITNPMAEFGFIVAATLGATAGSTDLTEGVFRHLVVTGRSRVALYLARIPAGLAIILPLVAVAFTMLCLVTSFEGTPEPSVINVNGVSIPAHLDEAQLKSWLLQHPRQAGATLRVGPVSTSFIPSPAAIDRQLGTVYGVYVSSAPGTLYPPINEMAKIGLWIELDVAIGFLVGLGVGSLIGQRTVSTILMIVLEIIVTPILANHTIPYFLDGQRAFVGVALDQLRPAGLSSGISGQGPGGGRVIFGGRGALGIPPMPTWAMVTVIVGWAIGWSVIGAWRMATRDA